VTLTLTVTLTVPLLVLGPCFLTVQKFKCNKGRCNYFSGGFYCVEVIMVDDRW
jgi:hypothetical protein